MFLFELGSLISRSTKLRGGLIFLEDLPAFIELRAEHALFFLPNGSIDDWEKESEPYLLGDLAGLASVGDFIRFKGD